MEMKASLILTVLASVAVSVCLAYPNTVPATDSVCRDMTPGHGFAPQKSAAPCRVTALKDVVRGGSQIQVTVSAAEGSQGFKGYYLQARSEQNGPIGTFTQSEMTKTHSCAGIKSNAAHHVSKDLKKVVPILWRAPAHYNGTVVFVATCVRDFDTFWTQIKSKPVRIQQA